MGKWWHWNERKIEGEVLSIMIDETERANIKGKEGKERTS